MAHDKSEPKVGIILKIGVLAIVTVIAVRFGLTSYFHTMEDSVRAERLQVAEKERPKKELDEESSAAVKKSMADMVKGGEAAFVHAAAASAKPALPCWAAVKCNDGPAASASAAPSAPPAPAPPKQEP